MTDFYFLRHGQASFGAANYDKLSDLGIEQSELTGTHFKSCGISFDKVYMGGMVRHRETMEGVMRGMGGNCDAIVDAGLNEYDFHVILKAYLAQHPEIQHDPKGPRNKHFRLLRDAMLLWAEDKLTGTLEETWGEFDGRVMTAWNKLVADSEGAKTVLVVSSGGPGGLIAQRTLGAPSVSAVELNLMTRNCALSHYKRFRDRLALGSFNGIPQFEHPERLGKVTHS